MFFFSALSLSLCPLLKWSHDPTETTFLKWQHPTSNYLLSIHDQLLPNVLYYFYRNIRNLYLNYYDLFEVYTCGFRDLTCSVSRVMHDCIAVHNFTNRHHRRSPWSVAVIRQHHRCIYAVRMACKETQVNCEIYLFIYAFFKEKRYNVNFVQLILMRQCFPSNVYILCMIYCINYCIFTVT